MIYFWNHWLFRSVLLNFHKFGNFSNFLLFLISNFIVGWSENLDFICHYDFNVTFCHLVSLIILNLLRFVVCPWRMFYVRSNRMCILLFLGGVFCRCLFCLILECCSSLLFPCLSSVYLFYQIEGRIFESPTVIVELFLPPVFAS